GPARDRAPLLAEGGPRLRLVHHVPRDQGNGREGQPRGRELLPPADAELPGVPAAAGVDPAAGAGLLVVAGGAADPAARAADATRRTMHTRRGGRRPGRTASVVRGQHDPTEHGGGG